jgi:hypothetical protein
MLDCKLASNTPPKNTYSRREKHILKKRKNTSSRRGVLLASLQIRVR